MDNSLRTFTDAERGCEQYGSTLAVIQSKEEQDFLTNFLFKSLKKVDNFWIGAKFASNKYSWIDHSELGYTNWEKSPHNKVNYCIQMQAEESVAGKWLDEPCEKKSLTVCQKNQVWSLATLQKAFGELKKNLVPIGFTYVQLPKEKSPTEIWSGMTWTDVTSNYAGLFFRAGGGDAASFGTIQADNAPHLESIQSGYDSTFSGTCRAVLSPITRGQSKVLCSAHSLNINDNNAGGPNYWAMKFTLSAGEVRPRNMAIKVWKRTA